MTTNDARLSSAQTTNSPGRARRTLQGAALLVGLGTVWAIASCGGDDTSGTGAPVGGSGTNANTGGAAGSSNGTAGDGTAGTSSGASGSGMAGTNSAGGAGGAGGAGVGGAGVGGAGGAGGAGGGAACVTTTGKALQFSNSVNDLMTGDLGADLPAGNSTRTIELWAKFTGDASWKGEGSVIEIGKGGSGNQVFGIDMADRTSATIGKFDPYTNGCGDNDPTPVMAGPIGWHHLAFSYDMNGKKFQFTLDGVAQTIPHPTCSSMLNTTPGIVTLGGSQSFGTQGWTGVMDEVRIWSTARPAADILRDMKVKLKGTETGLVAYYHLDDGGDFADDVGGTMAHRLTLCTVNGGKCPAVNTAKPMWVDSDVPGPFTCAP